MLRSKERQSGIAHFTAAESAQLNSNNERVWLAGLKSYTQRWAKAHRDAREDTWTVPAPEHMAGSVHAGKDIP